LAYVIDSSFAIDLERRRGSITELRDRFGDIGMAIATITRRHARLTGGRRSAVGEHTRTA